MLIDNKEVNKTIRRYSVEEMDLILHTQKQAIIRVNKNTRDMVFSVSAIGDFVQSTNNLIEGNGIKLK